MLIARIIVYFEPELLLVELHGAAEDVQYRRFIILIERLVQVVDDQAGLADGIISHEHNLHVLGARMPGLPFIGHGFPPKASHFIVVTSFELN